VQQVPKSMCDQNTTVVIGIFEMENKKSGAAAQYVCAGSRPFDK
jgi:hypothetical protein